MVNGRTASAPNRRTLLTAAIRREWPDGRDDLFGFTPDAAIGKRRLDRDERFWRAGPVPPAGVYAVPANAGDVRRHPADGCRNVSCLDSPKRGERW
ncbi:hypothetical protein B0E53_00319 [Micromonospora sp. MH33]|uniref:hypothetical protein n=1 Tax=Micromonospora sp. MH33 TaxID=1945509 RepID=UPI000D2C3459|nr:hypothetical protein [Micromonospora sp. MH33]PSK67672.1 hypothetical protein B0E53_00319 [Micromonospora sp. MH33]